MGTRNDPASRLHGLLNAWLSAPAELRNHRSHQCRSRLAQVLRADPRSDWSRYFRRYSAMVELCTETRSALSRLSVSNDAAGEFEDCLEDVERLVSLAGGEEVAVEVLEAAMPAFRNALVGLRFCGVYLCCSELYASTLEFDPAPAAEEVAGLADEVRRRKELDRPRRHLLLSRLDDLRASLDSYELFGIALVQRAVLALYVDLWVSGAIDRRGTADAEHSELFARVDGLVRDLFDQVNLGPRLEGDAAPEAQDDEDEDGAAASDAA